jgi:hypothetical protein
MESVSYLLDQITALELDIEVGENDPARVGQLLGLYQVAG